MKKTILAYILMILSVAFLVPLMNTYLQIIPINYFPRPTHIVLEIIITLLMFLIFLFSNRLYSQRKEERLAIVAGGFLIGAIFNVVHIFTMQEFSYDMLSLANIEKNPMLVYLLFANLILPLSIYAALIYKPFGRTTNNFRFKIYNIYFYIFIAMLVVPLLIEFVFQGFAHKFNIMVYSLQFVSYSLYIILASIFLSIRYSFRQACFPVFTLGLFTLGLGGLFYINPLFFQRNEFLAHVFQIIGLGLIFQGVSCIRVLPVLLKYKDEFIAYLFLLLVAFYVLFFPLSSAIFHVIYPQNSAFIFVEFILIFQLVIYIATTISWQKVTALYISVERDRSLIRVLESMHRISNQNILKDTIVNEINNDFSADRCFIVNYDKHKNYYFYDRYSENLPSKTLVNFDNLDAEELELERFIYTFNNINICFCNADEYIHRCSLKGTPQENFLKEYNLKSVYSIPIKYNEELLGYLILQYKNDYREFNKNDFEYLQKMATQLGIIMH